MMATLPPMTGVRRLVLSTMDIRAIRRIPMIRLQHLSVKTAAMASRKAPKSVTWDWPATV
jgi:hypothetical protein